MKIISSDELHFQEGRGHGHASPFRQKLSSIVPYYAALLFVNGKTVDSCWLQSREKVIGTPPFNTEHSDFLSHRTTVRRYYHSNKPPVPPFDVVNSEKSQAGVLHSKNNIVCIEGATIKAKES